MLLHFMKKPLETSEGEQIQFTGLYRTVKTLDTTGFSAHEIRNIPF